ncbi:MAG: glycoside hydrolase family 15 protein [Microbacteriaceae bacterium]
MSEVPIADHALLSDRHSAALVTRDGTIVWLCFPRFDSESVFASILDDDAGHWSIGPVDPATSTRSYVEGTMVLQTSFDTPDGTVELLDALELGDSTDPHRLGEHSPHVVLRGVRCTRGRVTIEMVCRLRPEYGLVVPVLTEVDSGVAAIGGSGQFTVSLPERGHLIDGEIRLRMTLNAGDQHFFALQRTGLGRPLPSAYAQDDIGRAMAATVERWQEWSAIHQSYDGPWRDLVHTSGRVLQALSYQPTGAIVAAATTSLPEIVGGERNWDYRYSWVRDASFTMKALWVAACPDEAHEFFDFVTAAAAHSRPDKHLQIMFGIGGEHDLSERVLPQLRGWRSTGPVRVGNGAWNQPQLDVYGEVLDAAFRLRDQLGDIKPSLRVFLIALADAAASQWEKPDNGIWEVRGAPRHFLYSKLMCWVALDRAVAMADQLESTDRIPEWSTMADRIRGVILERGWNEQAGAYTQSFGSPELDASSLMMPIVGFLPASDPRMLSTMDAILDRLTDPHGLVFRYRTEAGLDGVTGDEGTFLLCSFWLAQALAEAGRVERATEVFEAAIGHINDVGLLAEEVDPVTGEQLGNFPQAFSHVGLVNAAWAIHRASSGPV